MPLTAAGLNHLNQILRKGEKKLFAFDLQHLAGDNDRKVWGMASCPEIDREGEIIMKAAVEESLKDFMKLPVMHLNHTERPIGWFVKAEFRGQNLYVEGRIKPTSDCDDVWRDIEKGKLAQWSIYGDRVDATPSCAIDPSMRTEPCVTKALDLYSISLCDKGTAINSQTFAQVMKSIIKAKTKKRGCLGKATTSASNLIHPTTDGKYPKKGSNMVPEPEKKPETPMRDAGNGPSHEEQPAAENAGGVEGAGGNQNAVIELLTQVVERLQSLESSLGLYKAEKKPEMAETPEEEKKEEDEIAKCPAKKAEPAAPASTEIAKAELGKIAKAEARITELEAQITKIMKSTPRVPEVVVLDPALNKAMAKDDKGTMQPIEKSAGAANVSGFGRLFK